jgi:hypothetical protein
VLLSMIARMNVFLVKRVRTRSEPNEAMVGRHVTGHKRGWHDATHDRLLVAPT